MSDEEVSLKAGHPPATKVGGMRVVQHKPPHTAEEEPAPAKEKDEVQEEEKDKKQSKTVVISGAVVKEKDVYSPEATKAIHEKPQPTLVKHAMGCPGGANQGMKSMMNIQQARKSSYPEVTGDYDKRDQGY